MTSISRMESNPARRAYLLSVRRSSSSHTEQALPDPMRNSLKPVPRSRSIASIHPSTLAPRITSFRTRDTIRPSPWALYSWTLVGGRNSRVRRITPASLRWRGCEEFYYGRESLSRHASSLTGANSDDSGEGRPIRRLTNDG